MDFVAEIKTLHIACVLFSGSLFAARGGLMLLDSPWTNHPVPKRLSYLNDSLLLVAGLLLMLITQQYPFTHSWLSVKLVLLLVYILLGVFALRKGQTKQTRSFCFVTALLVYLFMLSVARSHHPLGFWATHTLY